MVASIAAIAGLVISGAMTGYELSKGTPDLPAVIPPKPPPAPPAIPPPPPPPPTDTQAGQGVADNRRKQAARFGVQDTLLASPLGSTGRDTTQSKSLLGG